MIHFETIAERNINARLKHADTVEFIHGLGQRANYLRIYTYARDGHQCLRCKTTKDLTLDHVIPKSRRGPNNLSNLQTLCSSCNCLKGSSVMDYRKPSDQPKVKIPLIPTKITEGRKRATFDPITGKGRLVDVTKDYCAELWNRIAINGMVGFSYVELQRYFQNYVVAELHKSGKQPYKPTAITYREKWKPDRNENAPSVPVDVKEENHVPPGKTTLSKVSSVLARSMKSHSLSKQA